LNSWWIYRLLAYGTTIFLYDSTFGSVFFTALELATVRWAVFLTAGAGAWILRINSCRLFFSF
jgi:hypothetical protein